MTKRYITPFFLLFQHTSLFFKVQSAVPRSVFSRAKTYNPHTHSSITHSITHSLFFLQPKQKNRIFFNCFCNRTHRIHIIAQQKGRLLFLLFHRISPYIIKTQLSGGYHSFTFYFIHHSLRLLLKLPFSTSTTTAILYLANPLVQLSKKK